MDNQDPNQSEAVANSADAAAERMLAPKGTAKTISDPEVGPQPSGVFLAVVAIVSFFADIGSKIWAEQRLGGYPGYVNVSDDHLQFVLAKNKGGAWGLLQAQNESIRRPFFLLVSLVAIVFIVTLYNKARPKQHALKWGLPLVLGGALGNVFDRVRYGHVIDFIDFRADWIKSFNMLIQKRVPGHIVTDHWPTFNVADVCICVGVGLMAIDMIASKRGPKKKALSAIDLQVQSAMMTPVTEGAPASAEHSPSDSEPTP